MLTSVAPRRSASLCLALCGAVAALDIPLGETRWVVPGEELVANEGISVTGELRCASPTASASSVIDASKIVVQSGGLFECGTAAAPMMREVDIRINGDDPSGEGHGIIVYPGGQLQLHGDASRARVGRLARLSRAGSTQLEMRPPGVLGAWQIGDRIVVSVTDYNRQPDAGQNEERVIASISPDGMTIGLDEPLEHTHYGGQPARFHGSPLLVDEAAYVANLRRKVVVRPRRAALATSLQEAVGAAGGHVIIHQAGHAAVSGVELAFLGDAGRCSSVPSLPLLH